MGRWLCGPRRQMRALEEKAADLAARLAETEAEIAATPFRASRALIEAAAQPDPPHPTFWLKIPLEGEAECYITAQDTGDAFRAADWAVRGPYSDAVEEMYLALRRDRNF